MNENPTRLTYQGFEKAYDHFNRKLFENSLPTCLITVQRKKGALGYFSGDRFTRVGESGSIADEIAMNPNHFASQSKTETLSTLVHEMVHLWQHHFGKPSRRAYHNKEWAAKMKDVGLIPSDTAAPGGHETGQRVSHYIEAGGPFERACGAYLAKNSPILYHDRAGDGKRALKSANKTKYTCPTCGQNAWARPEASLICGSCRQEMFPQVAAVGDVVGCR